MQKRNKLLKLVKAEIDLQRLTDLLAEEYMQQAAQELKDSIEDAERG
jgi:hypothetical protein